MLHPVYEGILNPNLNPNPNPKLYVKSKHDFLKSNKVQNGKLKLIQPKINTSNGGKGSFNNFKSNLNFHKQGKINPINSEVKISKFGIFDLLKNPIGKLPFKKILPGFKDVTNIKISSNNYNNSTTVDNETTNLSYNTVIKNYNNTNEKVRNNSPFHTNNNISNYNSNVHKLKKLKINSQIKTINNDFNNTSNKNDNSILHRNLSYLYENTENINPSEKSKNKRQNSIYNTIHKRNKSAYYGYNVKDSNNSNNLIQKINKTSMNETLHQNLDNLKKLRQNNSFEDNKEQGIIIIDEIIRGLSKLKTIISNENENENVYTTTGNIQSNNERRKIKTNINSTYKSTDSNSNNLLISSTTGDIIKVDRNIFNLMKNKTITQKTIDHDTSTIYRDDDYTSFQNYSNTNNNDSLMMNIKNGEKNRSFIENRYKVNDSKDSQYINKTSLNLKSIETNKKEMPNKLVRRCIVNNQNAAGGNKFGIEKFEYKILNSNKEKHTILNTFKLKNQGDRKKENDVLNFPDKKLKINNCIKIKLRENDDFANYEFID